MPRAVAPRAVALRAVAPRAVAPRAVALRAAGLSLSLLAAGLLTGPSLASAAPDPSSRELAAPPAGADGSAPSAEDALLEARAALARIVGSETEVVFEVERAERAQRQAEEAERTARFAERRAGLAVEEAVAREKLAAEELARQQERLGPRLSARYRLLRLGSAGYLLGASRAAEVLRLSRALDRLLADDLAALRATRAAGAALGEARAALESARTAWVDSGMASRSAAEQARKEAAARKLLLSSLRKERALRSRVVGELVRAQEQLSAHVRALPSEVRASGFAALQGRLPAPVPGGIVEVPFGRVVNPKFNTVVFQKGWDVRAREGSEVRAVAAGRVAHAAWFGGYGNLLILDHGDGFHSLYAHLSGMAREAGEEVVAGEIVGRVGDTGSLKGPYLYFELRQGGKPVDPRQWIGGR